MAIQNTAVTAVAAKRITTAQSAAEYEDLLLTLELAIITARISGNKVNDAVRACCTACLARTRSKDNQAILNRIRKMTFPGTPAGAVEMMREHIDYYLKKADNDGTS